jgi:hypothetical protein
MQAGGECRGGEGRRQAFITYRGSPLALRSLTLCGRRAVPALHLPVRAGSDDVHSVAERVSVMGFASVREQQHPPAARCQADERKSIDWELEWEDRDMRRRKGSGQSIRNVNMVASLIPIHKQPAKQRIGF